jgi:acetyl-CoA acetyltransferase
MREAVIVAGVRTAVGKAPRGMLRSTRPDDMAAAVIADLLRRLPGMLPESLDDVILGCATPEGESGTNVARIAALRAGRMPDWDVYDSVTSSAISPLTEKSVAGGSAPVQFPDFTRGKWQTAKLFDVE